LDHSGPEIDFAAIFKQFDTALIGRRTFDTMVAAGQTKLPGMRMFVFSRSLRQKDFPKVELASEDVAGAVSALKAASGKDIWLFGGRSLFRSLLDAKLVDTVEVVILGDGLPLLPAPYSPALPKLTAHKIYKSGIVSLEYDLN